MVRHKKIPLPGHFENSRLTAYHNFSEPGHPDKPLIPPTRQHTGAPWWGGSNDHAMRSRFQHPPGSRVSPAPDLRDDRRGQLRFAGGLATFVVLFPRQLARDTYAIFLSHKLRKKSQALPKKRLTHPNRCRKLWIAGIRGLSSNRKKSKGVPC